MKQYKLSELEKNNAKYRSKPEINNANLWLSESERNTEKGNIEYAVKCFISAMSGKKYE